MLNYTSMEESDAGMDILKDLVNKRFVTHFNTYKQVAAFLCAAPHRGEARPYHH